MKVRAAVLREQPGQWQVEEVELSEPKFGEVLVEMVASGLCHSDDHMAQGDIPVAHLPYCGGHEGGGIVRRLGPGVRHLKEGDHIITSFVPSCGRCRWCARGMQNLCDYGALMLTGTQIDGTFRMRTGQGEDVAKGGLLGTFATWQVFDEASCVRVRDDVPLEVACLVGCGVPTGWGSAVNAGQVRVGDTVIVMGAGGLGVSAVQGAAHAGATHVIVADPVVFKRDTALKLGATSAFPSIEEAGEFARSVSNGQGADSVIITVGVIKPEHVGEAFAATSKGGTVVVTAQGSVNETGAPINIFELSMYQKRIQGVLYGMNAPHEVVPRLLDLYVDGALRLDEMITQRYSLDQINDGYRDLLEGRNIRGVINYT